MLRVALLAIAVLIGAACRGESGASDPRRDARPIAKTATASAPAPAQPTAAVAVAPLAPRKAPRLPEDPIAGKRSEEQWREHLDEEERERQLGFDRGRMKEHRGVVRLFAAARARYDRARTEAAVAKVRAAMPSQIAELRRRVTKIDHWGVNSRLLPDYDALARSLAGPYADAKLAALAGDARALDAARADFDQRMKAIDDWLEQAAAENEDY